MGSGCRVWGLWTINGVGFMFHGFRARAGSSGYHRPSGGRDMSGGESLSYYQYSYSENAPEIWVGEKASVIISIMKKHSFCVKRLPCQRFSGTGAFVT